MNDMYPATTLDHTSKRDEDSMWLLEAMELYTASNIDTMLANIPEELEVDFNFFVDNNLIHLAYNYDSFILERRDLVKYIVTKYSHKDIDITEYLEEILESALSIQIPDGLIVNLKNGKFLEGSLKITKNISSKYQDAIKRALLPAVMHFLKPLYLGLGEINLMKNLILLLNREEYNPRIRSYTRVYHNLVGIIDNIISNDKWKIRDLNLAESFGSWVYDYVTKKDASALKNILKLKSLADKGLPIYSLK